MSPAAFHFDPQTLDTQTRTDGVSALLRVRDGARFLRAGLESCIDIFDEMVAVYHQCSDETPQILHDFAKLHPGRMKVYEYPHEVVPPNTAGHQKEGAGSVHTIAALCNYALSKTTRRVAIKHDADHVYIRPNLARAVAAVRRCCRGFVDASGVNLARLPGGELGVARQNPVCGVGDYGFFPVSKDTYFVHNERHEHLHTGALPPHRRHAGFLFWHMKLLLKNYGLREYRWRYENNLAELRRRVAAIEESLEVMPLEKFIHRFGGAGSLFIDQHVNHPLFRDRRTRPLAWHGARFLHRAGVLKRLPVPLLWSFALERDLRGAPLPEDDGAR